MPRVNQETAESQVTMFWLRSERGNEGQDPYHDRIFADHKRAAAVHGLSLSPVTVDEIAVAYADGDAVVRVREKKIDPRSAFFHTKLMPGPVYTTDLWRELTTCLTLEQAGFYVTIPTLHSIISNDKLLTLAHEFGEGIDPIPTVRISTRAYYPGKVDYTMLNLEFPVIVKPSDWGGGNAVFRVDDAKRLDSVLTLAGAAEMTMVIQPWLGNETVDYRIYCLDGEPARASERRIEASGIVTGNIIRSGVERVVSVPENLRETSTLIARYLSLPYVCVDFLAADGCFWFSGIEADGEPAASDSELDALRFGAYRTHFDRFLVAGGDSVQGAQKPHKRWRYVHRDRSGRVASMQLEVA